MPVRSRYNKQPKREHKPRVTPPKPAPKKTIESTLAKLAKAYWAKCRVDPIGKDEFETYQKGMEYMASAGRKTLSRFRQDDDFILGTKKGVKR